MVGGIWGSGWGGGLLVGREGVGEDVGGVGGECGLGR